MELFTSLTKIIFESQSKEKLQEQRELDSNENFPDWKVGGDRKVLSMKLIFYQLVIVKHQIIFM